MNDIKSVIFQKQIFGTYSMDYTSWSQKIFQE